MTRRIAAVCLAAACGWASAQEPLKPAEIKKLAQGIGDATVKGDYARVVAATYPGVVKAMGGRDEAIKKVELAMKDISRLGITVTKFTIGDHGELLTEGANTFTVVPTVVEMKAPDATIKSKGYLLGISADGGKTWTFADGAGLANEKTRNAVLPKLPEKLKLPEPSKPEVVKD